MSASRQTDVVDSRRPHRRDATATVNGVTNHGFAVRAVAQKH